MTSVFPVSRDALLPLFVVEGDITTMAVDAIVNAANTTLLGGGGVDGAIHRAAGPDLLVACRSLGGCATGDAKATRGYRLPASWIIHTVGPVWADYRPEQADALLASAYRRSIEEAARVGARTIAFPAISTGIYGFPIDRAAAVAVDAVVAALDRPPGLGSQPAPDITAVYFVGFSAAATAALTAAIARTETRCQLHPAR
ncbi:MAG: O-acetyl-ADP-ribose deacetylase [Azospirillaceae bacterium]|nr:O-acetyl-ADP-ribose deacetylase [Azospirillaceae bacterium]